MGKFRSLIYFTGRTGNVVGRKGPNGEFITAMHQPTVNQPNTEAQQALKAKLKLVSSTMNKFVAIAKDNMVCQNGRNYWQELIAANLDEAVTGSLTPGFEIDFSKLRARSTRTLSRSPGRTTRAWATPKPPTLSTP